MKYVIAISLLVSAIGCKQGEGQRCQVTADCKSPLTCNLSTMTCQGGTTGMFDAEGPEAGTSDAASDAPNDGPTDAPHD